MTAVSKAELLALEPDIETEDPGFDQMILDPPKCLGTAPNPGDDADTVDGVETAGNSTPSTSTNWAGFVAAKYQQVAWEEVQATWTVPTLDEIGSPTQQNGEFPNVSGSASEVATTSSTFSRKRAPR